MNCLKDKTLFVLFTFTLFFSLVVEADFEKKKIRISGKAVTVEVAKTYREHEIGLMFRQELGENEGMLFVFSDEQIRFFWMKNTFIDLSIGFFDRNKVLVDIQEMKSGKGVVDSRLMSYPSRKPAMYALEMKKNWYEKNKIKIGSKISIP